jgi:iron complex outermembrane recepter protein
MKLRYSVFACLALNINIIASEQATVLEQMSVTATKIEKATKDVSESIAVVD